MNDKIALESEKFNEDLESLAAAIQRLAASYQGDIFGLLVLLRTLEHLHQEIREDLFLPALPQNRQNLYSLLREIESEGGWPYIERMKLRSLLEYLKGQGEATEWGGTK